MSTVFGNSGGPAVTVKIVTVNCHAFRLPFTKHIFYTFTH